MNIKEFFDEVRELLNHPNLLEAKNSRCYDLETVVTGRLLPPIVVNCSNREYLEKIYSALVVKEKKPYSRNDRFGTIAAYLNNVFCYFVQSKLSDDMMICVSATNPLTILSTKNISYKLIASILEETHKIIDEHERCLLKDWEIIFENHLAYLTINMEPMLHVLLSTLCKTFSNNYDLKKYLAYNHEDPPEQKKNFSTLFALSGPLTTICLIKNKHTIEQYIDRINAIIEEHENKKCDKMTSVASGIKMLISMHENEILNDKTLAEKITLFCKKRRAISGLMEINQALTGLSYYFLQCHANKINGAKKINGSYKDETAIYFVSVQKFNTIPSKDNEPDTIEELYQTVFMPTQTVLESLPILSTLKEDDTYNLILDKFIFFNDYCKALTPILARCKLAVEKHNGDYSFIRSLYFRIVDKISVIQALIERKLHARDIIQATELTLPFIDLFLPYLYGVDKNKVIEVKCSLHASLNSLYVESGNFTKSKEHLTLREIKNKKNRSLVDSNNNTIDSQYGLQKIQSYLIENKPEEAISLLFELNNRLKILLELLNKHNKPDETLLKKALYNDHQLMMSLALIATMIAHRNASLNTSHKGIKFLQDIRGDLPESMNANINEFLETMKHLERMPRHGKLNGRKLNGQKSNGRKKKKNGTTHTEKEQVYCNDPFYNKSRFQLWQSMLPGAGDATEIMISNLKNEKNAEALKLLVIACCNRATYYRRDCIDVATSWLSKAKKYRSVANKTLKQNTRESLIPFIDRIIAETTWLTNHSLSKKDIKIYRQKLSTLDGNSLKQLYTNLSQRFLFMTDDMDKDVEQLKFDLYQRQLSVYTHTYLDTYLTAGLLGKHAKNLASLSSKKLANSTDKKDACFNSLAKIVSKFTKKQNVSSTLLKNTLTLFLDSGDPVLSTKFAIFSLSVMKKSKSFKYSDFHHCCNALLQLSTNDNIDNNDNNDNTNNIVQSLLTNLINDKILSQLTNLMTRKNADISIMEDAINCFTRIISRCKNIEPTVSDKILALGKMCEQYNFSKQQGIIVLKKDTWRCYDNYQLLPLSNAKEIVDFIALAMNPRNIIKISSEALDQLKLLRHNNPNNIWLHFALGHHYFYAKRPLAVAHLLHAERGGHIGATYLLGKIFLRGMFDRQKDPVIAVKFFKNGADKKHHPSTMRLAMIYKKGVGNQLPADTEKAKEYARLAVDSCPFGEDEINKIKSNYGI